MIVAHPDDESLFAGAELIANWKDYLVIAIDKGDEPIRKKEFLNAMSFIGINQFDIWENYTKDSGYRTKRLKKRILSLLKENNFRKIVSHGPNGEYGHSRHIACHNLLVEICPDILWYFSNKKKISSDLLKKKKQLLKFYSSQKEILKWYDIRFESLEKYT
tara:strand:- start:1004 stop:1486 length:483 start_codon:yes stop_codon:yes gene_type:complete